MPNGEYGTFLPTEAAYTKPGAYGVAARTEATKRAAYLSSMDQFYAQLEEVTREFEKIFGLKEKEFGLRERELEGLEEYRGEELGLRREELGVTKDWYQKQFQMGMKATRGEGREFEPYRTTSELGREEPAGVPLDWLGRQLQEGRGAAPTTNIYYGSEYQAEPSPTPTGYTTPEKLPSEFYQTEEGGWRNY